MGILISLLMNAVVAYSAWLLSSRILALKGCIDTGIAWLLLYFAQIVFSELLLGILGILYLPELIVLNVYIMLFVWWIARRRKPHFEIIQLRKHIIEFLDNKVLLLFFSVIAGFGLVKICVNLVNPPFGWDCLNYHFVFPVEWLKNGNLSMPSYIGDDPSPPYYPLNGSLYFLWLMLPLKNVFFADVGQVPFFLLAFLSLYGIARKTGLGKSYAFYVAALFILTPNIFRQIEIAYVDVMLAALFFSSVNFILRLYKTFSLPALICVAVSFGLFLGIKASAIVYGIFPLLCFACIVLRRRKEPHYLPKAIAYVFLFASIAAALGGFSYLRNLLLTGNPLFPADIVIAGKNILKGVVPFANYRNNWTPDDFNLTKLLFHEGMGVQFIIFAFPALMAALPFLIGRIIKKRAREIDFFVISLPLVLWFSFLFFMPQLWVRYLYAFVGSALIAAFYMLATFKNPGRLIKAAVAICVFASMVEISRHAQLLASVALSLLIFYLLHKKWQVTIQVLLMGLAALPLVFYFLNARYDSNEFKNYVSRSRFPKEETEAWLWLNQNTGGHRIAYAGRPDVLPLYGSNFKNEAAYVSVNNVHPVHLHNFIDTKYVWTNDFLVLHKNLEKDGYYRQKPDYYAWLKNLDSGAVDFLVVYSLNQVEGNIFPIEEEWARSHPGQFFLVFGNDSVRIYKVTRN
ncbi:MAG: hypothetical protein AB1530_07410 [Candidatus Omnitrophota bacterium]